MLKRMIDRGAVDPAKIRTIYKSQTFPTTGYGHAHNLHPTVVAKIKQAFFTFQLGRVGSGEGVQEGRSLHRHQSPHDWAVIRKIDAANGVSYECK